MYEYNTDLINILAALQDIKNSLSSSGYNSFSTGSDTGVIEGELREIAFGISKTETSVCVQMTEIVNALTGISDKLDKMNACMNELNRRLEKLEKKG